MTPPVTGLEDGRAGSNQHELKLKLFPFPSCLLRSFLGALEPCFECGILSGRSTLLRVSGRVRLGEENGVDEEEGGKRQFI